jgi:NAD(P)-dependent dehydrogenase (short-subunit alcohol dehydrogenase family)
MNLSSESKVALVTGAASGLGLATAKAFAESQFFMGREMTKKVVTSSGSK